MPARGRRPATTAEQLLAQGKRTEEVATITGYSRSWIYELVWGYNRLGESALGDKQHSNPGGKPLLDDLQQTQLAGAESQASFHVSDKIRIPEGIHLLFFSAKSPSITTGRWRSFTKGYGYGH